MRLGQLARKLDVPIQEMISYLQEANPTLDGIHPNASLSQETEALLAEEFDPNYGIVPEEIEEVVVAPKVEVETPTEEVIEAVEVEEQAEEVEAFIGEEQAEEVEIVPEETLEPEAVVEEPPAPVVEKPAAPAKPEKVIETDKLMELLESEEGSPELDEITLIRAPKRELDGLKVVGKIELPEPRVKSSEKTDQPEKAQKSKRISRQQQAEISEQERKKRVLVAKKKRAEAAARKERQQKEREKQEIRARKEEHYRKKVKLKKADPNQPKRVLPPQKVLVDIVDEPASGSLLSRFWKWLNT
ncbi:MAG: hypothetical protein RIF33_20780 [Cyclobacteriaceae bacterium]